MASNTITEITPVLTAMKSTRFTAQDGWQVCDMELGESSVVALSGYHSEIETDRTFVDLIVHDPSQVGNCRVIFTREFEKYGNNFTRYVSFLGESIIVTSNNDRIESYDTSQNVKINDTKFDGLAASMTASDGEVYVGLYGSNKVIVFNSSDLTQIKTITLSGIDGRNRVCDIAVVRATLFVRTRPGCKALVYSTSGVQLTPEPLTAMDETEAESIGVSSSGMLAVLWWPGTLITVFDMTSLIEGHGGRHAVLFSVNVDDCWRIWIMNNRLVTVHLSTGEVREYDVLSALLAPVIDGNNLKKLVDHFAIPPSRIIKDINDILQHLTEAGMITHENDTLLLIKACSDVGLNDAVATLSAYQKRTYGAFSGEELRSRLFTVEQQNLNIAEELASKEKAIASLEESKNAFEQTHAKHGAELNTELQETCAKHAELQKNFAQLQNNLTEETSQKAALSGKIGNLQYQLDQDGRDKATLQEESRSLQTQLHQQLSASQEELKKTTESLKKSEARGQKLVERLQALEGEKQDLTDRLNTSEVTGQSLKNRLETLEHEKSDLKDRLKASEVEGQSLTVRLETLEGEKSDLNDRLKVSEVKGKSLTDRLVALEGEKQDITEQLATLVSEKQNLTDRLKTSEVKGQSLTDKLGVLEGEKQELTDRLKTSEVEGQSLTDKLGVLEGEKQELTDRLKTSEVKGQSLTDKLGVLEEEKQELTDRLKTSEIKGQSLTDRLEALEGEAQSITEQLATLVGEKQDLTGKLKTSEVKSQSLIKRLEALEVQKRDLTDRLKTSEVKGQSLTDRLQALEGEKRDLTDKLKTSEDKQKDLTDRLEKTIADLHQSQLERDKESKALKEVMEQAQKAVDEKEKEISEVDAAEVPERDNNSSVVMRESTLAAEFGRLMVGVAEELTLDDSLKLACLFGLSPAQIDLLRRLSIIETPGNKLLDILKERDVINMFDVINLKKGLLHIQLDLANEKLLEPYQERVEPQLLEENRTVELLPWPEAKNLVDDDEEPIGQEQADESLGGGPDTIVEAGGTEPKAPASRRKVESPVAVRRYHNPHIEQMIGSEGGTINVVGVSLSVPADALMDSHVIAVEVMYDHDLQLPGEDGRSRITPLMKLVPLGQMFERPVAVTIPHSAVIPEPGRHKVAIYTGQRSERNDEEKDKIIWTEENSLLWRLHEDTVTVYIHRLSYLSVSLVSEEAVQKHIVRVVSFIDGIMNPDDDIIITICLCKDNDDEYNSLLEDYQSKLRLGDYITYQIIRTAKQDPCMASLLEMSLECSDASAYYSKGESLKTSDIDHVCEASRVSQHFTLQKNIDICVDTTILDVELFVRHGSNPPGTMLLKTKIRNLFISAESKKYLIQALEPDLKRYEELKLNIASQLGRLSCQALSLFFGLTPVENERILNDEEPGKLLMKILDEREMIMPTKMVDLYEGLKATHLDKEARKIMEYTESINKSDEQPKQKEKATSETPKLSILVEEGFIRSEIVQALGLSQGRVDLGRKLLQVVRKHKEMIQREERIAFYKEQFVGENGGDLALPEVGVHLTIPADALPNGRIVNLSIITGPDVERNLVGNEARISQIVRCGPDELLLRKPASLRIPHCGLIAIERPEVTIYCGEQQNNSIKWKCVSVADARCKMQNRSFEIQLQRFSTFFIAVRDRSEMKKQMRALPFINRIKSPTDDVVITLWLYNDDAAEHQTLIHDETIQHGKMQLSQHSAFILEPTQTSLSAHIGVANKETFTPMNTGTMEINHNTLWTKMRHKVEFHLSNRGNDGDISLVVTPRSVVFKKKPLCTFKINVEMQKLLSSGSDNSSPTAYYIPKAMLNSFDNLKGQLSTCFNTDKAVILAIILGLPPNLRSIIKRSRTPGSLLLNKLIERSIISAGKVAPLERALMNNGDVEEAKLVQEYRRNNVVISGMS